MISPTLLEEFNLSPSRQLGIPGLDPASPLNTRVLTDDRSRGFLDFHLRRKLNWGEPVRELDGFLQIVAESAKLLNSFVRFIGVVMCSDLIRENVDGKAMRMVKQSLGSDLMNFVMYRRSLLRTAAPPEFRPKSWGENPLATVIAAGQSAVLAGCQDYPAPVAHRTRLKFGVTEPAKTAAETIPIVRVLICEVKQFVPTGEGGPR